VVSNRTKLKVGPSLCAVIAMVMTCFFFTEGITSFTIKSEYNSAYRSEQDDQGNLEPNFKLLVLANGRTGDGTPTFLSTYATPAGNKVYKTFIEFNSTQRSKEQLGQLLKIADKVIEKGPKKDRHAGSVGDRIVIILPEKKENKQLIAIAWTSGQKYVELSSTSQDDLLAFEKITNP